MMIVVLLRWRSCARTAFADRWMARPPKARAGEISATSRRVSWLRLREAVTCPGMTVTSVPDQPMSAKRLHIVVDSRLMPMARQNCAQRATASAGGHDTVYTVMRRLFRRESSGRRGGVISISTPEDRGERGQAISVSVIARNPETIR